MNLPATKLCHWPNQDVPCCEKHAGALKRVYAMMGAGTLSFSPAVEGSQCVNCQNEASKAANATDLG